VGCRDVVSADGDVQDLVREIAERGCAGAPLLYLAGEDRSGDLGGELATLGMKARTVVVYRAVQAEVFPAPAREALLADAIDGVLHFSRRSARVYVDCAKAAGILDRAMAPSHYCLSRQVAKPLAGAARVRVAWRPEEAALIDLIASG
jgi:uroporphyrinogen-III synthase